MTAVILGVAGTLAAAGLALEVILLLCVRKLGRRIAPATTHRPPVSVLRPVCGLDDDFEENLSSLCEQTYPGFEIVVISADPDDTALPAVRRVQHRYPSVPMRVVAGAAPLGKNPKVTSLMHGSRVARHEWLLVSDSNVRTHPDYLARLLDEAAAPGVGMVANLVVGVGAETFGAQLENLQLGAYVLPATAAADVICGVACVMGKSMLFRRSDLQALGGFETVADYLAEDFLLGRAFHRSGRRVIISRDLLRTVNRRWSLRKFFSRHLRWNQIRCRVAPWSYLAEGLAVPSVPLLAMVVTGAAAGDVSISMGALFLLGVRVLLHMALARTVGGGAPFRIGCPWLVVLRDLFVGLIWLIAPLRSKVTWRGQHYRLGPDSRIEPVSKRSLPERVLQPEAA